MVIISKCRDTFCIDVLNPEKAHNMSDEKNVFSGSFDPKQMKEQL